jgi:hypothetical protein
MPRTQFEPATRNIDAALAAPAQANPANMCRLRDVRSAIAPTIGSSTADKSVAKVTAYGATEPAATGIPSTSSVPRHGSSGVPGCPQAAVSAIAVRYGPNRTAPVVVTKPEFAQS